MFHLRCLAGFWIRLWIWSCLAFTIIPLKDFDKSNRVSSQSYFWTSQCKWYLHGLMIAIDISAFAVLINHHFYCVKSVRIRSYSGLYFLTFGLNTERYGVSLRIQSKGGKIRTRITLNTDTLHAVFLSTQSEI